MTRPAGRRHAGGGPRRPGGGARPDPRSPLVVDVREVGRRPGAMRALERVVPAPGDLGAGLARVPEGSDVRLRLRLESVVEGVLVSGTAAAPLGGECSRCLGALDARVEVPLQQLYAWDDAASADDDDVELVVGDLLDLEPALRDAVVLALPLSPVCRQDCPGLCPECGAPLADEPEHEHDAADPRWAALRLLADPGRGSAHGDGGERAH